MQRGGRERSDQESVAQVKWAILLAAAIVSYEAFAYSLRRYRWWKLRRKYRAWRRR